MSLGTESDLATKLEMVKNVLRPTLFDLGRQLWSPEISFLIPLRSPEPIM